MKRMKKWQRCLVVALGLVLIVELIYVGMTIQKNNQAKKIVTEVRAKNQQLENLLHTSYDSKNSAFLNMDNAKNNLKKIKELANDSHQVLAKAPNVSNKIIATDLIAVRKEAKKLDKQVSTFANKYASQVDLTDLFLDNPIKNYQFNQESALKEANETKKIDTLEKLQTKLPDDEFKEVVTAGISSAKKQNSTITKLEKELKTFVSDDKIIKEPSREDYRSISHQLHLVKNPEIRNDLTSKVELLSNHLDQKNKAVSDKKLVALTFDDGPNNTSTPRILDILKKNDVKATFFVLGSMVDANPTVVKRAHDEGHVIANHSYSHANLINLDEKGIQNEVIKTNQKIEKIIGEEPYLLRPPYGSFNSKVKNATGMEIALWNVDSLDWKTRNSNAILKQVKSSVLPHSVILMHDIYSTTADSLDPMIKHLKSQGYEFCFVDELIDVI